MSISNKISKEKNVIVRTVVGELIGADMTSAFNKSISHPDFKKNMHVIWDLTKADISEASIDQIMNVVRYIADNIDDRGEDYKIIVVAPIDISFGISRMFGSYGGQLPVSIHIVRILDEAFELIVKPLASEEEQKRFFKNS